MDSIQDFSRALGNELATRTYWKYKDGINRIRILPNRPGTPVSSFIHKTKKHFKVGPNSTATDCLRFTGGKCAVCDFMEHQAKLGIDVGHMEAESQYEFSFIAVDTLQGGVENLTNGSDPLPACIWPASSAQTSKIVATINDENWGNISDPATGKLCTVEKIVKGKTTVDIRFSPNNCPVNLARVVWPERGDVDSYEVQLALLEGVKDARSGKSGGPVASSAGVSGSNFPFSVDPPANVQQTQPQFMQQNNPIQQQNPFVAPAFTQSAPVVNAGNFDLFGSPQNSGMQVMPPVVNTAPVPPAIPQAPAVPVVQEVKEWQALDNNNNAVGPFTKTVTVTSNAKNANETLKITGTVNDPDAGKAPAPTTTPTPAAVTPH